MASIERLAQHNFLVDFLASFCHCDYDSYYYCIDGAIAARCVEEEFWLIVRVVVVIKLGVSRRCRNFAESFCGIDTRRSQSRAAV